MRDIETIIQYAEQHGIDSEPDHEVGDLQDMLRTFWQKADEHTRQKFITSAEVTALLNMNEPDFTLILCPAHAENSLTLDCTEGWNDKCQIEHVRTVPTIEDMAWVCPECGHEIVHDYDALCDVGNPICSDCDVDMERLESSTLWVGLVQVEFSHGREIYGTELHHICLSGREWNKEDDRLNEYVLQAWKRAEDSRYADPRVQHSKNVEFQSEWEEGDGEYCQLDACKASGLHLQHCDDDGYCIFCGEQE